MHRNLILLFLCIPAFTNSQSIPVNDNNISARYPFISTIFNRINDGAGIDSFYAKLYLLKTKKISRVNIVHIGDSHIQADFLSGEVRKNLQEQFGDAGRGLVFPYRLAKSNSPADIIGTSPDSWQYNRLAHPEIDLGYGISGFGIHSQGGSAALTLGLGIASTGRSDFKHIRFFMDAPKDSSLLVVSGDNKYYLTDSCSSAHSCLSLRESIRSFDLQFPAGSRSFYGASLTNGDTGLVYHTIGVNGARYDQYNSAEKFWQQLPALEADLYIISLGTNEAQRASFPAAVFEKDWNLFIDKIKEISPHAAIIVTTAPDSYKGRGSNKVLRLLNEAMVDHCSQRDISSWDLYKLSRGYGSAYSWVRRGLMSRDRIHFTAEGYRIQGQLLYNAIAKGYNNFIRTYQKGRSSSLVKDPF